jgi:hypothetical protein
MPQPAPCQVFADFHSLITSLERDSVHHQPDNLSYIPVRYHRDAAVLLQHMLGVHRNLFRLDAHTAIWNTAWDHFGFVDVCVLSRKSACHPVLGARKG